MTRRRSSPRWMPSVFPTVVVVAASVPTPSWSTVAAATSAAGRAGKARHLARHPRPWRLAHPPFTSSRSSPRSSAERGIERAIGSNARSAVSSENATLPGATRNVRRPTTASSPSEPSSCGSNIYQTRARTRLLLRWRREHARWSRCARDSRGAVTTARQDTPHSAPMRSGSQKIVFCNGMPHSGSTLQYDVVRVLLEASGVADIHGFIAATPGHTNAVSDDQMAEWAAEARYHVVKTHDRHPLLRGLVPHNASRVCYIYRDLRDVAASSKRAFGQRGTGLLSAVHEAVTRYLRASDRRRPRIPVATVRRRTRGPARGRTANRRVPAPEHRPRVARRRRRNLLYRPRGRHV